MRGQVVRNGGHLCVGLYNGGEVIYPGLKSPASLKKTAR
jgi:hypothetical protein